jgi:ABC-type transport system substrate-binding protein
VRRALPLAFCLICVSCKPAAEAQAFRLRFAVVGPLTALTPTPPTSNSGYAQEWVFESLLRTAPDGSNYGALASRFEMLSPSRVRLELRPNSSFSDGSPVTPEHVRDSLMSDGVTFQKQGSAFILESRSGAALEPILRHVNVYKQNGDSYLGSGPFRIVAQTPESLLLERVHRVPGKISEVLMMAYPTPRETFAHTLAGDADLAVIQDAKQSEFFRGVDRVRVIRGRGANAIAVGMGMKRLGRPARKALAANIPGSDLSHLVFGEHCPPFPKAVKEGGDLPPHSWNVAYLQNDVHMERMALALARVLGANGGEIQPLEPLAALSLLTNQNFDLMIVRPLVWPPSSAAIVWASDSPYNQFGYSNPRVDAALKVGDWARALQELQDDPPVAFICTPERLAVVDSRVKNPQVGPYAYFETLPDWEIAE